jgi:hypothetical protein
VQNAIFTRILTLVATLRAFFLLLASVSEARCLGPFSAPLTRVHSNVDYGSTTRDNRVTEFIDQG